MTTRDDITKPKNDPRLVYTCRCGWVDKGHAKPNSAIPTEGATNLINNIMYERGRSEHAFGGGGYLLTYGQYQRKSAVTAGRVETYWVRYGLSYRDRLSVALAIFMEVSIGFETFQSNFPWNLVTKSGFSEEDLVSNLIGFYTAASPGTDYVKLCDPVSVAASLKIWDDYGGVGDHKNFTFRPNLYPCSECMNKDRTFPSIFSMIQPMPKGDSFRGPIEEVQPYGHHL